MTHDLIIFDCDGTLVDSEYLYNAITAELLNGLGFDEYTPELCIELFAGQAWSMIKTTLEEKHGQAIPRDIVDLYIKTANSRMDTDLQAPDHAHHVLETLSAEGKAVCVASNGERNNVIKSLNVTGLFGFFDESRIFTKIQVERPKPAPDLFLFTAEQMGFTPAQCLVIEDSPTGVRAAKAAGMSAIGFTGTAHDQEKQGEALKTAGADVVTDTLIHIPEHANGRKAFTQSASHGS